METTVGFDKRKGWEDTRKKWLLLSLCVGLSSDFSSAYQWGGLRHCSPHLEFFKHDRGYALGQVKINQCYEEGQDSWKVIQFIFTQPFGVFLSVEAAHPQRRSRRNMGLGIQVDCQCVPAHDCLCDLRQLMWHLWVHVHLVHFGG